MTPLGGSSAKIRAPFMSREMWLAWLMRPDARDDASVANLEAQREFAAWWVVRAREEFPDFWTCDEELTRIACEPRLLLHDLQLPRLLALIYESRPDLRAAFPLPPRRNVADLARWYHKFAHREYSYAPPLPDWFIAEHLPSGNDLPRAPIPERRAVRRPPDRFESPGVNLIGYPGAEFGIGEDVRMASAALADAGVPHVVFDLRDGGGARQEDMRDANVSELLPYGINIVCVSAFDAARLWLQQETRLFAGRYNIGYFPWELERFPIEWVEALELMDEIWGASSFTTASYASLVGDRARLMPPSVAVKAFADVGTNSDGAYRFLCAFDPSPSLEIKNPAAAAKAFLEAFPAEIQDVRLVFAVNGVLPENRQAQVLRDASRADRRIEIREGAMDKADRHRLIAQSNCLVSPHRAGGFGRIVAEAKALGVAVIATGYSGSNDFLDARERVSWSLTSVGAEDYPHSIGLPWADVQIDDLAKKMREFYHARISAPIAPLSEVYSVAAAGHRYKSRLDEIAAGRAAASPSAASPCHR